MRRISLIAGVLGVALAAQAAPALADYGALAYDDGAHKYGFSWNEGNERKAEDNALKSCGSDKCKVVFRTGSKECGAIATSADGKAWGAGKHAKRDTAQLAAIENCQKRISGQCKIKESECNR